MIEIKQSKKNDGNLIRIHTIPATAVRNERADFHRIVGVGQGAIEIGPENGPARMLQAGAIAFVPRHTDYVVTAPEPAMIVTCIFRRHIPLDTPRLFGALKTGGYQETALIPTLKPDERIATCLAGMGRLQEFFSSEEYSELKVRELILTATLCYGYKVMARFFMPLLQVRDNFEEFVLLHYEKAASVTELAAMAGMGISTFKRKFTEIFGDSIYQWMMKQKAVRIRNEIRAGNRDIQDLMSRFGFHFHSHFNRFCHIYLGGAPSCLIKDKHCDNQFINYKSTSK